MRQHRAGLTHSFNVFTTLVGLAVLTVCCGPQQKRGTQPGTTSTARDDRIGAGRGSVRNAASSPCVDEQLVPSRTAFLNEVLFSERTARTPLFDDYTPGSYHVEKADLVVGLQEQARACQRRLYAMLVVGPVGMLWTFHVVAFLEQDQGVQLNALVMPHARITGKRTGLVPRAEASSLISQVRQAALIRRGIPHSAATPQNHDFEFSYNLLLAILDGPRPQYFHANVNDVMPDPESEDILNRVNRVLEKASTVTYRHGESEAPARGG